MGLKIIAMSLWGVHPMYHKGALINALEVPKVYPGWRLRVYTDYSVPDLLLRRLAGYGAEVVRAEQRGGIYGMFWRFLAAADPAVELALIRDADSVVNVREKAAVDEWLREGQDAHVMFDHPHHHGFPMFGGMWGCKGRLFPDMQTLIDAWKRWDRKPDDMHFLTAKVWPRIQHHALVHGGHFGRPFPAHASYPGFVGQQLFDMPWWSTFT